MKNSIAIDGVSLTISKVDSERGIFRVSLIKHTIDNTSLSDTINKKSGPNVNLEFFLQNDTSVVANTFPPRDDLYFMSMAVDLAEKGRFSAPPNPWVGCVIVDPHAYGGGRVIST